MDIIRSVLNSYAIKPMIVDEITNNLYRVYDGQNFYALKKSSLKDDAISRWENVFHQAYAQNLEGILPVVLTKSGSLYEVSNHKIFYCMPWYESNNLNEVEQIKTLHVSIGKIHAKTKQSIPMDVEIVRKQFSEFQAFTKGKIESLLDQVVHFEKNRFMSPFELQVCTHYRDLELVIMELTKRTEQFIYELSEQDDWNYSLCHGQLADSHAVFHQGCQLFNWELANFNNGITDLAYFYKQFIFNANQPIASLLEAFDLYTNENALTNIELYFLVIQLLDTTTYMKLVEQYVDNAANESMIKQIQNLQQEYRRLSFAMKFSEHIEQKIVEDFDDES